MPNKDTYIKKGEAHHHEKKTKFIRLDLHKEEAKEAHRKKESKKKIQLPKNIFEDRKHTKKQDLENPARKNI